VPQIVFFPVAEAAGSGSSDHQSSLAPDAQDENQGNDRHPQVSSFFASAKHTTFSHHVKLLNPLPRASLIHFPTLFSPLTLEKSLNYYHLNAATTTGARTHLIDSGA
jgi:hypothetical protein